MTNLHAQIMNIPCTDRDFKREDVAAAYRLGHKAARHAAAELVSLAAPEAAEPVAWCALSIDGKQIAYFDGKPMVMPGRMGNDCHPVPLYAGRAHTDSQAGRDAVEAARYRCLRAHSFLLGASSIEFGPGFRQTEPELLDARIDALRAALDRLSTTTGRAAE